MTENDSLRQYVRQTGRYLDDNFEPNDKITLEIIVDLMNEVLVKNFASEISVEQTAEEIAYKLELARTLANRN